MRAMEFMDPSLENSYSMEEAWRCFHVGLLCVQESPEERPTMSSVGIMLRMEQAALSSPMTPPSLGRGRSFQLDGSSLSMNNSSNIHSVNEVTLTYIEPR